jgi:hypothetical protein
MKWWGRGSYDFMSTFAKVLLLVGIMCLALAGWSMMQGEIRDVIFGFGLGGFLLMCWRWTLGQSS